MLQVRGDLGKQSLPHSHGTTVPTHGRWLTPTGIFAWIRDEQEAHSSQEVTSHWLPTRVCNGTASLVLGELNRSTSCHLRCCRHAHVSLDL